jgi:isopentenyl diphosphate isomerase/L-lactate dehydrogenase-like FMN-dependent dehydrogenase
MMKEIRAKARELMAGYCRVCPVCDGRACAGEVPGMGGLGTGSSFRANLKALADLRLNMRVVHNVSSPSTDAEIFGRTLEIPVLAAPIGGVAFNMGGGVTEEAYVEAVLGGCLDVGVLGCTGDGVPEELIAAGLQVLKSFNGRGVPFIKPWADEELYRKLDMAVAAGAKVIGMDVDAAGLVTLKKMGRPVSPKPLEKLREIINRLPGRFVVKGIMTEDDAKRAVDAGASAIVVSNHGGRVLDHTPGTAEVLPRVSEAVHGQATILADGGVRSGVDVLKMLALGADAVLIGRPISVAAVGGGREGVRMYLEQIRNEFIQAMVLTGSAGASKIKRSVLHH